MNNKVAKKNIFLALEFFANSRTTSSGQKNKGGAQELLGRGRKGFRGLLDILNGKNLFHVLCCVLNK